ncbi:MAG TPA: HAD family hydrolase [Candidatus Acidoferrales bacterium]|nr:HAD family hydrolase [Candidatus Acidoferrales bacterium]
MKRAVFLDRDGTLMIDKGFVGDPQDVELLPTVVEGLRALTVAGFAKIVVSNQSGVARGYFTSDAVGRVNAELRARLQAEGVDVDAFYFCPHYEDGCDCRKPAIGLLERAAREHGVDVHAGAVIGDRGSDIGLAQNAGVPGVLMPAPQYPYSGPEPDYRAQSFLDAARWIVEHVGR